MQKKLTGFMTLFIFFLILIVAISSSQHVQQINKSYEALIKDQEQYRLEFFYQDSKSNIPRSLVRLLKELCIDYLSLQMGFINPSSLSLMNLSQQTLQINHGISIFFKNTSTLSPQNYQSIAQVFSISRSPEFMIYLSQAQLTYASNPNDKFCSQHFHSIIETFLPCRHVAGIGSILNARNFHIDKPFAGVKLQWKVGKSIRLVIMMDRQSKEVKNYLKMPSQKRFSKRCMHFGSYLYAGSFDNLPRNEQSNEKQCLASPEIMFTSSIKTSFPSNYYNPQKKLIYTLDINSLQNDLSRFMKKQQYISQKQMYFNDTFKVQARILLPKGFQVQEITYFLTNSETSGVKWIGSEVTKIQSYKQSPSLKQQHAFSSLFTRLNTLIKLTMHIQLNRSISDKYENHLKFHIHYKSNLNPFQQYEAIAGGGQQLSNIPVTVKSMNNNTTFILVSNQNSNMFDRLLEPDFSIPFKTITFTVAIFGYIWIAVWKAFYLQKENERKMLKMSFLKEQQVKIKTSQSNKSIEENVLKVERQTKQE